MEGMIITIGYYFGIILIISVILSVVDCLLINVKNKFLVNKYIKLVRIKLSDLSSSTFTMFSYIRNSFTTDLRNTIHKLKEM